MARINDRHFLSRIRPKTRVKSRTTLIPPELEDAVQEELRAIELGSAEMSHGNRYTLPSGRVYVDEGNGTFFPVTGPGLIGPVERGVLRALCVLARYNGPSAQAMRHLRLEKGIREVDIVQAVVLWRSRSET